MAYILNSEVRHVVTVQDLSGIPVTGLTSANFTTTLRRRSGASLVTSAESVSVLEIGGGQYWFYYTPTAAATLYILSVAPVSLAHALNPDEFQDTIEAASTATSGPYLTTRENLKTAFGWSSSTDRDAKIDALLPQVTDLFQTYCNRQFVQASVTEYPAPLSSVIQTIIVGRPPIASVTSLWVSTAIPRVYDSTTLLVNGTDYLTSEDGQWVELVSPRCVYGPPSRVVKITYVGGYATIPGDLERAAQEVIGVKIAKASGNLYHVMGVTAADGAMTGLRFDDVTPNAQAVMDAYRLMAFA